MDNKRNFITKCELDAIYYDTLELISKKFFGEKQNIWDDVLPAAAEILSSEDFDNNAYVLLDEWENEIKKGLPSKSIDVMSEEEIKKYSKENQPIFEVFKRCVKMYVLFCYFSKTDTSNWGEEITPQEKVKYRMRNFIQEIADGCNGILSNKRMISEINRCSDICQGEAIGRKFPVYDVRRFAHVSLDGLCDGNKNNTMGNEQTANFAAMDIIRDLKEQLKEKNEEIDRLTNELSEKDKALKELMENSQDCIEFYSDIEQLPSEKPCLSVRVFVLHELLRNFGCTKDNKRALALFSMLLLGLDGARALASKNNVLPKKGESFILEDNCFGKEIKLFNAILEFGLNVDNQHLLKTKQDGVNRVCKAQKEDYEKLANKYIKPNNKQ